MTRNEDNTQLKLLIARPTMGQGGADRVTLIMLQQLNRERFNLTLALMRAEGEFLADIPKDVKVVAFGSRSLWTMWLPLARLLRSERPDIVFVPCGGTSIAAVIARWLARYPARLVLSERTVQFRGWHFKRRLVFSLKRLLFRRADHVIALSEGVKRELIEKLRVRPERVSVVYSPIDVDAARAAAVDPVQHAWFHGDIPVIMTAARLVPQKNIPTLIEAIAILRRRRRVRLVLFGEGPLLGQLKEFARSRELTEDDICFAGFDKNPFRYMARCTVFVLASKHEGLGTSLIQAMGCGAPVVATDYHVGASEIVTDGVDGFLVPVGDSRALAEKIEYLLDHPEVRERFSAAARRSAERFGAARIVEQHQAVLLAGRHPTGLGPGGPSSTFTVYSITAR